MLSMPAYVFRTKGKIEYKNKYDSNINNYWIDPTKLQNYTLPTFTKMIVKFLESNK